MIIYGKRLFCYLYDKHSELFEEVYLSCELPKDEFKKVAALNVQIIRVDEKKAQALATGGAHQGILAKVKEPQPVSLTSLCKNNFIVVLCGITDIGNIGQIIRSAFALGIDGIVFSGSKNFALDKAAKSSSGALFDMPFAIIPNTLDILNELKMAEFAIYGADASGGDVKSMAFATKKALILGSEFDGIPQKALQKCDYKISIKMQNNFDSLNVAAAAAILMDRMR